MRRLYTTFLKGLAVVLPLALTVYATYWLVASMENLMRPVVELVVGEQRYVTGMGLLIAAGVVLGAGALIQIFLFERLFRWGEGLLDRLPLVKTIYHALKDFFDFMTRSGDEGMKSVVSVRFDSGVSLIGLVTNNDPKELRGADAPDDLVAVYLPMSYMIGGYTILVRRARLTPVDIGVEEALRLVLTAGVRSP